MLQRAISFICTLSALLLASAFCKAENSTWSGKLNLGQASLTLVLNIDENTGDELPAMTLDSPDQGAKGIPAIVKQYKQDSISFEIPQLGVTFTGKRNNDTIEGTFMQMGHSFPLTLQRGYAQRSRPQTPKPPYSYKQQDIIFPSAVDTITLAGTLTLPSSCSKATPVIVMISGSGQQNRDEEVFEHKPFAVLADRFANAGIASLRYDDRGVGSSSGNPATCTTQDFALDAEGAIKWLKQQGYTNIGVLGHSEGGSIAFILAGSQYKPSFIVTLGAPAVQGAILLADQITDKTKIPGLNDAQRAAITEVLLNTFNTASQLPQLPAEELKNKIKTAMSDNIAASIRPNTYEHIILTGMLQSVSDILHSPWMRYFLAYDPTSDMKNAHDIPTLALYGGKDVQVSPTLNAETAKKLLPKNSVKIYGNLNHLMQPADTGSATEYAQIETTIDEQVIADIITFISNR